MSGPESKPPGDRDRQHWQRVDEVFIAVTEAPPEERAERLRALCGDDAALHADVLRLLESDGCVEAGFLESPAALRAATSAVLASRGESATNIGSLLPGLPEPYEVGRRVGPYVLERELGRGGMGVVFLATREGVDFDQKVALKLVRLVRSEEILERFLAERRILANLVHPNIARLLDGGVADEGLPYLAMEFVDGLPIDRYCDEKRLDVDGRLDLFCQVCNAVQYAHNNLVVHRDLKPTNILVTESGDAKLVDFGIAKLLDPEQQRGLTRVDTRLLTPEYGSPEQARGEPVTTASDVYSLGVVLYELLAGHRPYRIETTIPREIERIVCDQVPLRPSEAVSRAVEKKEKDETPRRVTPDEVSRLRDTHPSRLPRILAGDLDTIVLKAIQKEPARRYSSVDRLRDDIERYRKGLPVLAQPDTWLYRTAKFLRRHKAGVAACALLALSLLLGIAGTGWQAMVAAEEADRARLEASKAESVLRFLMDLFTVSDPSRAQGETVTARELLDRGAAEIEGDLDDQPELKGYVMRVMGVVYSQLGLYDEARRLLESSLELRRKVYGEDHEEVAEILTNLGVVLEMQGHYPEAEERYLEALGMLRDTSGPESRETATMLRHLGRLHIRTDDIEEAIRYLRQALPICRKILGERHREVAITWNDLGGALERQGNAQEAEAHYLRALEIERANGEGDGLRAADTMQNLGVLAYRLGDFQEARGYFERVLEIRRRLLDRNHPQMARALNNQAAVLEKLSEYEAARPLYEESIEIKRQLLPPAHPSLANSLNNLGLMLMNQGDLEDAEPLLRESLEIRRQAFTGDHSALARGLENLGTLLQEKGEPDEARTFLEEARAMRQRLDERRGRR